MKNFIIYNIIEILNYIYYFSDEIFEIYIILELHNYELLNPWLSYIHCLSLPNNFRRVNALFFDQFFNENMNMEKFDITLRNIHQC